MVRGVWEVMLGGSFKEYESAVVQRVLEDAFARDEAEAEVEVRSQTYIIELQHNSGRQVLKSDRSKTRPVRRRPLPAGSSAAVNLTDGSEAPAKRARLSPSTEAAPAALPAASAAALTTALPTALGATSSSPSTVLVFAPGAGGSTAKAMKALQDGQLTAHGLAVFRCDDQPVDRACEARWITSSAGCAKNVAHVVAVARRAAAAHPGVPLLLCGASFGNRVICEVCSRPTLTSQRRRVNACGPVKMRCGSHPSVRHNKACVCTAALVFHRWCVPI